MLCCLNIIFKVAACPLSSICEISMLCQSFFLGSGAHDCVFVHATGFFSFSLSLFSQEEKKVKAFPIKKKRKLEKNPLSLSLFVTLEKVIKDFFILFCFLFFFFVNQKFFYSFLFFAQFLFIFFMFYDIFRLLLVSCCWVMLASSSPKLMFLFCFCFYFLKKKYT